MGKPTAGGEERAVVVEDKTFGATGNTEWYSFPKGSYFNIAGNFDTPGVGTVRLEISFDGGETSFYDDDTTYTANFLKRVEVGEEGALYRLNCSAYTSGSIITRISG